MRLVGLRTEQQKKYIFGVVLVAWESIKSPAVAVSFRLVIKTCRYQHAHTDNSYGSSLYDTRALSSFNEDAFSLC